MSDLAIVTSDNPRTEDPLVILAQVREGIPRWVSVNTQPENLPTVFPKRGLSCWKTAAMPSAWRSDWPVPGDIVLLAGKGHEDYQIIGRPKHHFDDREEAALCLL